MILDPTATVAQLKAQSSSNASFFIGNRDATMAFKRYELGGDGLDVLKTKYATNKVAIIAKWNELKSWVEEQASTP